MLFSIFLRTRAMNENIEMKRITSDDFYYVLERWIRMARVARNLEPANYLITEVKVEGQSYSFAKIKDESKLIVEGGQWKDGVHQLLHARLQQNQAPGAPPFLIEHERKTLSTQTKRQFLDFYDKKGRLFVFKRSSGSSQKSAACIETIIWMSM